MEKNMMEFSNLFEKYINLDEKDVKMLNPLVWAFIGDAVFEVIVRSCIISNTKKSSGDLHKMSVKYVKASAQSQILDIITPVLTEEEAYIVKRGRNTKTTHVPKNADMIDYRRATAFEALIGYLYLLKRSDRLDEIFKIIFENL
jgi:ribonuclease-3 family protein